MVSVRLITLTIVGFILGAFAAGGVGVRVIREVRSVDDATSLPAQNIARDDGYHVDPSETLISSVALLPGNATFSDDGLSIPYELISIAPSLGSEGAQVGAPLYPKRWLIEAIGGEFEATLESPDDTTVVFPLLAGGTFDQIDTVKIVEAYIPAPFEIPVTISSAQPTVTVMPGIDIELVGEVADGDTTTIEVRILADEQIAGNVLVVGDGPGWKPPSIEAASVMLTLVNAGDGATEFPLTVFGTRWVPVDGEFVVNVGAADE